MEPISLLDFSQGTRPSFDCGAIGRVAASIKQASTTDVASDWPLLVMETTKGIARVLAPSDDGAVEYPGPYHITLFHNTTGAVQRILTQLDRRLHDTAPTLLTTDMEFPGCLAAIDDCWSGRVVVARIAADLMGRTAWALESETSPLTISIMRAFNFVKPRIIYLSHIMRTTGEVLPVALLRYFREANPRVVIIVDGSQAIGNITVESELLSLVDFYIASGHKWLGGMTTLGIAWCREPEYWQIADPAQSMSYSGHQGGTGNLAALLSLRESLKDMYSVTPRTRADSIQAHNASLASYFRKLIIDSGTKSIGFVTPFHADQPPSGLIVVEIGNTPIASCLREKASIGFTILGGESVLRPAGMATAHARAHAVRLVEDGPPNIEPVANLLALLPEPTRERLRFCFHYYHGFSHIKLLAENVLTCSRGL